MVVSDLSGPEEPNNLPQLSYHVCSHDISTIRVYRTVHVIDVLRLEKTPTS